MTNACEAVIDAASFVRAHTQVQALTLVPEIRLHLAASLTPVWEATEARAGRQVPPPYWAACWPGGKALARLVLDRPELVRGRHVLDFGSGGGVVAIAASLAGAHCVVAAEVDPLAVEAAAMNALLNAVSFEWLSQDAVGSDDGWDVVCAGDVCYERPMANRVIEWLRTLSRRGALVLLGDPGRSYVPREGIETLARYRVPVSRDLEEQDVRETSVWRLLE